MAYPIGILTIASLLLLTAALSDIRRRRVSNLLNVALAATGLAAQAVVNGGEAALGALLAGAGVLAVLWFAWTNRLLGAGDVKLAVGTAIWVGHRPLLTWVLAAFVVGGGAAVISYLLSSVEARRQVRANLRAAASQLAVPNVPIGHVPGRVSVPYGAAFAAAGMVVLWIGVGGGR